jgi:hypothetical protein
MLALVGASLLAGCGSDPPPRLARAPELRVDPMVVLGRDGVHEEDWARRVLYTWTTADQISQARASRTLLSKGRADDGRVSWFDAAVGRAGDPILGLFMLPGLSKRRYGWVSAWATAIGEPGHPYGDRLVRVELRDESIIVALHTDDNGVVGPLRFRTAGGSPVGDGDALAHPERIAAVYHQADRRDLRFREYVLVNEAAIARWSYGTEAIRSELEEERAMLRAVRGRIRGGGLGAEEKRWSAALALGSASYAPTLENVEAIAKALEAPQPDAGFEVVPTTSFDLGGATGTRKVAAPPPPPRRPCVGTMCE